MAYFTAGKRGKMGSRPGVKVPENTEFKLATMYSPVEMGGKHPDGSRRMTNIYGKMAGKRNEVKPEVGENSRRTGRMFNWMKGESY